MGPSLGSRAPTPGMCGKSSQKTRNTDELPRPVPHFQMMRSVDVHAWVEEQWEHYVEEGSD